jgi:hypothetical protein
LVEHNLAKVGVAGSNPVVRSTKAQVRPALVEAVNRVPVPVLDTHSTALHLENEKSARWVEKYEVGFAVRLAAVPSRLPDDLVEDAPAIV